MFNFERLEVYSKALELTNQIFLITENWPKLYLFNLTDQLRRASLSIPLNIAEGSSRTKNDFKHFLGIARGSCFECIPIIEIASKRKLIDEIKKKELYNTLDSLARMLSSLKNSI